MIGSYSLGQNIFRNGEKMKTYPQTEKEKTPLQWGRWEFDEENMALVTRYCSGKKGYSLPLVLCNSSAEILDWITSIHKKSWARNKDIGDLVEALDDLLGLRENFIDHEKTYDKNNPDYSKKIIEQRMIINGINNLNKKGGE